MITVNNIPPKEYHTFPGGEVRVQLDIEEILKNIRPVLGPVININIKAKIKNSNDLLALEQTLYILRTSIRPSILRNANFNLNLPYLPYARQDRICNAGEINGVDWILRKISDLGIDNLRIFDVHNPSAIVHDAYEYMNIEMVQQKDIILNNMPLLGQYDVIVAPDRGAIDKVELLINYCRDIISFTANKEIIDNYKLKMIAFDKTRDQQTGRITSINISEGYDVESIKDKRILVVDDICDGGGTFSELGYLLKVFKARKIDLYVTHGIFSKGFGDLLGFYNNIITTDSWFDAGDIKDCPELQKRIKVINL